MATIETMLVHYEKALVCITNPGNIHDQYVAAVGKNGMVFATEGCTYLYSISEENNYIHCRVTGQQSYSVNLRQGSVRLELWYK